MTFDKEDLGLGLSLSLGFHQNQPHHHFQLNLMTSAPSANNTSWNEALFPSDRISDSFRTIDRTVMNRLPSTADCEEPGVSSPNSTISGANGKRNEREVIGDEQDTERASSRGISDEEDGENSRKKLRLTKDQSAILEESFKEHITLNPKQKTALAKQLDLRPRQVEVWFQNRRARTKLKQTEVDYEFLKRCCENMTDENRRLQKEVQELRVLKLSPQFYMHMTPPTTLTVCPSCERVGGPPFASSKPDHTRTHQMGPRPMAINPWTPSAAHIAYRTFDTLRPRS